MLNKREKKGDRRRGEVKGQIERKLIIKQQALSGCVGFNCVSGELDEFEAIIEGHAGGWNRAMNDNFHCARAK